MQWMNISPTQQLFPKNLFQWLLLYTPLLLLVLIEFNSFALLPKTPTIIISTLHIHSPHFLFFSQSNGSGTSTVLSNPSSYSSSSSSSSASPMSSTPPAVALNTTTTLNPPPIISQNLASLGLGYAIAIAFAFLVLLSTILLASYVCCRATRHRNTNTNTNINSNRSHAASSSDGGIIVPRFIFVAEDDDSGGDNSSSAIVGLDPAVINSYPRFPFSKSTKIAPRTSSSTNDPAATYSSACSICLCEYREAEMLRMMPDCRHFFHLTCIDTWLRLNGSCPVCRNSPMPTPVSTPLAEVVPLSQYAADRRRS